MVVFMATHASLVTGVTYAITGIFPKRDVGFLGHSIQATKNV